MLLDICGGYAIIWLEFGVKLHIPEEEKMTDKEKVQTVVDKVRRIRQRNSNISVPKAGWLAIGSTPAIKQHEARKIHSEAMSELNAHADVAQSTPA